MSTEFILSHSTSSLRINYNRNKKHTNIENIFKHETKANNGANSTRRPHETKHVSRNADYQSVKMKHMYIICDNSFKVSSNNLKINK